MEKGVHTEVITLKCMYIDNQNQSISTIKKFRDWKITLIGYMPFKVSFLLEEGSTSKSQEQQPIHIVLGNPV
ncbi:MAG: hypothetical protein K6T72_16060 [Anoxybacillus sp.]|nr:hypothetical protein [Anoxybacillus sp.]MCL6587991.1 hypothetical protein [Anoxybacillus sp.]